MKILQKFKFNMQLFGGRGASSSSSGGGAALDFQKSHLDKLKEPPSVASQLSQTIGVSEAEAEQMAKAVHYYSGAGYTNIRQAQYSKDASNPYYEEVMAIENLIDKSPKWGGGEIYRGMHLSSSTISQLEKGAKIDMKGMSSWTTKESLAKSFSKTKVPNESPVIFKTTGTKKGTSITHLSRFGKKEEEVLVSGSATWTIKSIKKSGKTTIVELAED